MALKTRDKLIEVARQLFAHKGVENTTMLDIANASEKGRRTIYTYFKNKREIHQAVIERESEQIVSRQRQILESAVHGGPVPDTDMPHRASRTTGHRPAADAPRCHPRREDPPPGGQEGD